MCAWEQNDRNMIIESSMCTYTECRKTDIKQDKDWDSKRRIEW